MMKNQKADHRNSTKLLVSWAIISSTATHSTFHTGYSIQILSGWHLIVNLQCKVTTFIQGFNHIPVQYYQPIRSMMNCYSISHLKKPCCPDSYHQVKRPKFEISSFLAADCNTQPSVHFTSLQQISIHNTSITQFRPFNNNHILQHFSPHWYCFNNPQRQLVTICPLHHLCYNQYP